MTPHAPTRSGSRRRRGFTIVELLVVIGIIALLVGISFFAINKARRSANMARIKADFVAISTAIDQFKADHKALPGMMPNVPPGVVPGTSTPSYPWNNALAYCLVGPADQATDGSDGPGFRYQKSNGSSPAPVKHWPSYLDVSKFNAVLNPTLPDGTQPNRGWELMDPYAMPILYLPRRKTGVRPSVALLGNLNKGDIAAYDVMDVDGVLDADERNGLLMALGDLNRNNRIDAGETANFNGDYILISAGPDAAFFTGDSAPEFQKADDVYNFDR